MRKLPIDILKERIDFAYDADSIVDMLDISVVELLEAFEDKLVEKRALFDHLEDNVIWEEQEQGIRYWIIEEEVFDDDE